MKTPILDNKTKTVLKRLEEAGFSSYAVGGAVRDFFLEREVFDYDITTNALPEQTKAVFSDCRIIETGIKHGTVTVIYDGTPFEITTFRTESGYGDNRHPDCVMFVGDLTADLSRRDFTVNAVAYSPAHGITDPFGGINDIEKRIIKTVGDPKKRFSEDALRILRALRFSSTLGFDIDDNTTKAIFKLAPSLGSVSHERVYQELSKLLCGENAVKVLTDFRDVIENIIPIFDEYILISHLPKDIAMRFACVCGGGVCDALTALRADKKTARLARTLAGSTPIPEDATELKLYASSLGRVLAQGVAVYRRALYGEDAGFSLEKLLKSGECLSVSELAVNGEDIESLGYSGREVGVMLKKALDAVLRGYTVNEKDALLAFCFI